MPKQTYYNLPEDKRDRIIRAIEKEFSRVPVAEVSINRIIREADISRGSFYQYFDDKEDLVAFVVGVYRQSVFAQVRALFSETRDMFDTAERLFSAIIRNCGAAENINAIKYIYLSIDIGHPLLGDERDEMQDLARDIVAQYGMEDGIAQILPVVDILYAVFKNAILQLFYHFDHAETLEQDFKIKIDIIRRALPAGSIPERN